MTFIGKTQNEGAGEVLRDLYYIQRKRRKITFWLNSTVSPPFLQAHTETGKSIWENHGNFLKIADILPAL